MSLQKLFVQLKSHHHPTNYTLQQTTTPIQKSESEGIKQRKCQKPEIKRENKYNKLKKREPAEQRFQRRKTLSLSPRSLTPSPPSALLSVCDFHFQMDCWSSPLALDDEFEKLVIRMNPPRYFLSLCVCIFVAFIVLDFHFISQFGLGSS